MEVQEKGTQLELDLVTALNNEVREHRQFLERQFKQLTWAIGVVLGVALTAFFFFVWRTKADLQAELKSKVDQSAIMYQINEKLRGELDNLVKASAASVSAQLKKDAQQEVGNAASSAVSEALRNQGEASLKQLVEKAAEAEVGRFAASSLRASLSCTIVFRGTQGGLGSGEYVYQCPAGYSHIMNANIYTAGKPTQWQSLCCRVIFE